MKHPLSAAAVAVAVALASGSTQAADLPSRKAPAVYAPPPPAFTWTGFYAGLDVGGGWLGSAGSDPGVSGGGQIGYNHQLSPLFVVGLETDFQGTSIRGASAPFGFGPPGGVRGVDWFGTVRGRVGVTPLDPHLLIFGPQFLIFGTGGFAYGQTAEGGGVREGWTAGGGVEWAFAPNWSTKIEYLYTDLGRGDHGGWLVDSGNWLPARSGGAKFHTVRLGLNYHFNLFAPASHIAHP